MAKKRAKKPAQSVNKKVLELLRYDMLIAFGICILVFIAGLGIGKYYLQPPMIQARELPTSYNLNCNDLDLPELDRIEKVLNELNSKKTTVECVTEMPFKYIQPAHNKIKYSLSTGNLMVQADSVISDGRGGSMIPVIFEGNTLIIDKYYGQKLEAGMIIVYKDGNQNAIHRISSAYGDEIVVKGDANNVDDGIISKEQVSGIVIGVLYT